MIYYRGSDLLPVVFFSTAGSFGESPKRRSSQKSADLADSPLPKKPDHTKNTTVIVSHYLQYTQREFFCTGEFFCFVFFFLGGGMDWATIRGSSTARTFECFAELTSQNFKLALTLI